MPTYTFKCKSGHLTDRVHSMDNVQKTTRCSYDGCNKRARRDFSTVTGFGPSSNWPQTSAAMGVHPDQIEEATKDSQKMGVPTEFNSQGDAVFTSRSHRRRFLRASGAHDHDGGYGD